MGTFEVYREKLATGLAQSVQQLATGWTVRGSNLGGDKIFRAHRDRPLGPPSFIYSGTGSLSRV